MLASIINTGTYPFWRLRALTHGFRFPTVRGLISCVQMPPTASIGTLPTREEVRVLELPNMCLTTYE